MAVPFHKLAPSIAAAVLVGCSGGAPAPEPTSTTSAPIYGGVVDDDAKQNASVVAIEIGDLGDASTFTLCSGSLVGPNVVLTARHCVSSLTTTAATQIACDDDGGSTNGADFGADVDVSTIQVFVGPSIYQGETPSATAKALYHPSGTTLCNGDVALIVLDTNITSVAPMRVRVSSPVTTGETIRAVGFGENDQNQPIGTRFRKDDISIIAVGPTISPYQTPLGSNEFEVGESTCLGDSGGPAIDEGTGAIVGVVSRGQSDCTLNYGHVYTTLESFVPLFQAAFAAAGGTWLDENGEPGGSDGGSSAAGDAGGGQGSPGNGDTPGGSGGYQGGVDLHSGQGANCSAASSFAGSAARGVLPWAFVLLGLVFARRRYR